MNDEVSQAIIDAVKPTVVAVYSRDRYRHPEHIGSGTILEVRGRWFVLTAAHVLDELSERASLMWLAVGDWLGQVDVDLASNIPPDGDRESDNRDFGFFEVDRDEMTNAGGAALRFSTTDLDEQPDTDALYLVLGFPSTRQAEALVQGEEGKEIEGTVFPYRMTALPATPEAESGKVVNLDLKFDLEDIRLDGEHRNAPSPRGMSGGPAFSLSRSGVRLSGIIISHEGNTLRTTRPIVRLKGMESVYPELFPKT